MSESLPAARDVLAFDGYEVSLKQTWGDSWQSTADSGDIEPLTASQSIAPEVSRAEFLYHYGNIKRQGSTEFLLYPPLSLEDWFVKVSKVNADNTRSVLWVGVMAADEREIMGGGLLGDGATGDQRLTAFGLELLLDRVRIDRGWIGNGTTGQTEEETIDVVPVFNESFVWGFKEVGNRSSYMTTSGSFVFSKEQAVWDVREMVRYLLAHLRPGGIEFKLSGATADLANIVLPRVDVRGMTLREALNMLIDRRRGLGWRVRFVPAGQAYGAEGSSSGDRVYVEVFTASDTNITVEETNEVVLRGNTSTATFDIDRIDAGPVVTVRDSLSSYGMIRVLGRPIVSCFSLGYSESSLVKAWTDDEENNYKTVSGATPEEKDAERATEKYRHVYQTFLYADQGDADSGYRNPKLNADGSVDVNHSPPIRKWGHSRAFLPTLPLVKTWSKSDVRPEYRLPMAFVQYTKPGGGTAYGNIERIFGPNTPPGSCQMLDNQQGVFVQVSPNHALGKNHFGTATTRFQPAYDYATLKVTVAAETDARLKYEATISGNDADRVLTIEIDDAEFWWIAKGTITDVTNGALVKHDPPVGSMGDNYPGGCVIRNDVARLRRIGAAAKGWYGRKRAAVRIRVQKLLDVLEPGTFLRSVEDPTQTREVGAIVTQREWDFARGTTTFSTGYAEMDFTLFR